jgi:KUP system potassium uptake protein
MDNPAQINIDSTTSEFMIEKARFICWNKWASEALFSFLAPFVPFWESKRMSASATDGRAVSPPASKKLMLAALGVVYGDIGTSPLYAFKQSIEASGGVSEKSVFAVLSLIIWALILVVTIKYVFIIMRANNRGEGGTIALTSLALGQVSSKTSRWVILATGLIGVSLFYGDCVITPAISVLSAVEGLNLITPLFNSYIVPITVLLITALFAIERHGTAVIGKFFGPIMLTWFLVLAALGVNAIIKNPQVLLAINPVYGFHFLIEHPGIGLAMLGAVVLAVTGGEALYADMGHFGIASIRRCWLWMVFPALTLNYMGQGATVLANPAAIENPFYLLAPSWAMIPMVILSAAATIIASQAVISGAFSITSQAVQLGYIPRIRVRHTSSDEIGQVYISQVNIFLYLSVIALVLTFRSSEHLAAAYGIAVTGSMAIDTALAYFVMVKKEHWNPWLVLPLFAAFFVIDIGFFSANILKFFEGGWFPIVVAACLFFVMAAWISGRERLLAARWRDTIPLDTFIRNLKPDQPIRVPGTAIFMVPNTKVVPSSMLHNIKHNRVLHERVILMTVETTSTPYVADEHRMEVIALDSNFFIVKLHYGFFEEPRIMRALAMLRIKEFKFKLSDVSFFVGREKLTSSAEGGWTMISDKVFIALHRNMLSAVEFFRIPADHVVELGGHIEL